MTTHLTTKQLAERWRMHVNSLANWRVEGKGPRFVKVGKVILYSVAEIEAYEKKKTQRSTVG